METSDSESTLITIGKWGILSVQIPGYFPLTTKTSSISIKSSKSLSSFSKRFHLSFKIKSPNAIYAITLLICLSLWDVTFFSRQSSFTKYLKARGHTELYAYTLMLAMSSILGIYITIFGLRNGNRFLNFWKETCQLLDQLQDLSNKKDNHNLNRGQIPLNHEFVQVDENKEVDHFKEIQRSTRNSFLSLIIPVTIHVIVDYGYRITNSIVNDEDGGDPEDTELAVGLGFWTFFALTGSGISIWMSFFIQFYTACLHCVREALKSLRPVSQLSKTNSSSIRLPMQDRNNYKNEDELFTLSRVILNPKVQERRPLFTDTDVESDVDANVKVFQSIIRRIDHFNDIFGVVMIFEMSVCVLNLLVYLFFVLVWLGRGEIGLLMETVVPTYIYGKELYDMGTFSEDLTSAADSVVRVFAEDLPLEALSSQMHLKLQMLATQISTNPPAISAKQFFLINRSLVTAVLSGLATFLVVLVQFRDADSATTTTIH